MDRQDDIQTCMCTHIHSNIQTDGRPVRWTHRHMDRQIDIYTNTDMNIHVHTYVHKTACAE